MSSPPVPVPAPSEVVSPPELPPARTLVCANCDAPLAGEYCSACGQRYEPHVHALGHFVGEAFESVTHADSRLWRTLGYLLVKPGHLTREFFRGKRARYLPPFRLYLVISVLFFVVAGLNGHLDVDADDEGPATPEKVENLKQAADKLEADLPNTPGIARAAAEMRRKAAEQQADLDAAGNPSAAGRVARRPEVRSSLCEGVTQPSANAGWTERARWGMCERISKLRGEDLIDAVVHNIPRAMFVFLPLLAAVMKLLYWRPRRYYVEHLLFLVHNHAFVFLAFTIMVVSLKIPVVGQHLGLLATAIWLYVIYYIFRAMRVYYGQSRLRTFGKYLFIGFAYVGAAAIVLVGTALYSALTL
jgi:hypothetical protein